MAGRKRKDGDRFPNGKLKPAPKPKVILTDRELDLMRRALRAGHVADPLLGTQIVWDNFNQKIDDGLAGTALDCAAAIEQNSQEIRELMSGQASHNVRIGIGDIPGNSLPDDEEIPEGLAAFICRLPPRERRAIEDCAANRHPDNRAVLERALRKVHAYLGKAPLPVRAEVMAARRSEVGRAIPEMLAARGLEPDDVRAMVAIASANVSAFAKLNAAWFAVAVEKAQAKFPDFDVHHADILQALRDGAVPRTASPTHDVETAYHFIKKGGHLERTTTDLAQAK